MAVKWYSNRFIDRLRPGDEIPEGAYTDEHLDQMLKNGIVRREVIDDAPEVKPKKATAKKAATK